MKYTKWYAQFSKRTFCVNIQPSNWWLSDYLKSELSLKGSVMWKKDNICIYATQSWYTHISIGVQMNCACVETLLSRLYVRLTCSGIDSNEMSRFVMFYDFNYYSIEGDSLFLMEICFAGPHFYWKLYIQKLILFLIKNVRESCTIISNTHTQAPIDTFYTDIRQCCSTVQPLKLL